MLSYSSSTTMQCQPFSAGSFSSQKSHSHQHTTGSSFKISDLILAEHMKPFHLGKPCKPLTESIMTKRNGKTLHRWRRIKTAPFYFKCVEKNSGIDRIYRRVNKTMTKAKREGKPREELNRFKMNLFKRALQPDILRYVDTFGVSRYNINKMMNESYRDRHASNPKVFKEWVPAGIDGGQRRVAKLPTMAVKALHTTTVKGPGVSFGGYAAMPKSDNDYYKQLHNNTHKIMEGDYLMREVFNLSETAVKSINEKKSTLLREVHAKCVRFEAARCCGSDDDEVYVGEHEDVFEIKIGVYFVPAKSKVYKFLHRPVNFPEFFSEVSVGLHIEEAVKGVCGITSVCPEHFCFEMKYCGPNLDAVVRSDYKSIGRDKKAKETCVYNVIMMQSTPGQFTVPLLSGLLRREHKNTTIRDANTAIGVFTIFRNKILDDLPFFLGELINIVTRLGQQGLVNLDIKAENFVVDGATGQPKMIDFNIVLPSGHKDPPGSTGVARAEDFENSPQTPPEYLKGQRCFESSMSFCLAHTLRYILKTLSRSGNFTASSLHMDMKLSEWIARSYNENIGDRPAPHMAAVYIGSAFPFEKEVRDLFLKPKHIIACKLDEEK